MIRLYVTASLAVVFLLSAPIAGAQQQTESAQNRNPGDTLSLRAVIDRIADDNPNLRTYALQDNGLDGERLSAGLSPPMQLGATAEEFGGTQESQGVGGVELTLALSGVVELGGRPGHRQSIVDSRRDLLSGERRAAELDLFADAARLYIELAGLQHERSIANQALALAETNQRAVAERVNRARAPAAELARAKAATARARLRVEHIAHQVPAARVQLAALWGQSEPNFKNVDHEALLQPGEAGDFDRLAANLERNPDIARFNSLERLERARLRLAQSSSRGEVGWRAGVKRLEGSDSTGLVAGISIPLFAGRRSRGDVSAAEARSLAAGYDGKAALVRTRATLYEAYQHRSHAIEEFTALREAIVPQLEAAAADTRAAYSRGRYSYLELVSAQRELIDARLALIDAARRAHINRIELERLAGAPLEQTLLAAPAGTTSQDNNHDH